MIKGK